MIKSSIEITDNAYLIKLDKSEFEYPLVRKLLNRLLSGSPQSEGRYCTEEDPDARYLPELSERFDFLVDK